MEKRTLGRTGLDVTVLGHGAMEIRGPRIWSGRPVTDGQAERILNAVLDAGINLIDTAWDYGLSEERIGKFISRRRDEYFLATKCGCTWLDKGDHDETPHVWTRENLMHNIETSLQRMQTDYVDIWQLHNPSPDQVEAGDLVAVMQMAKQQGKIRHVAISSALPHLSTFLEWDVFDVFQIPYSGLERRHEEVITDVAESGAGVIIRGGVAKGEPGSGRGSEESWDLWEMAELDELLEDDESPTAFLLRFTISHPRMHTTIVGTLNPNHLAENIASVQAGLLAPEVYEEACRRLDKAGEKVESAGS